MELFREMKGNGRCVRVGRERINEEEPAENKRWMEREREGESEKGEAVPGVKRRIEESCEERFSLSRRREREKWRMCAVRRVESRESEGEDPGRIEKDRDTERESARWFSHRPILGAHGFGAGASLLRGWNW